jgi:3-dehydroquinate dehydratase
MEKEYPNITEFKVLETKVGNLVTKEEFRVFSARASVIYAVIMIVIVYGPGWLKLLGTG